MKLRELITPWWRLFLLPLVLMTVFCLLLAGYFFVFLKLMLDWFISAYCDMLDKLIEEDQPND